MSREAILKLIAKCEKRTADLPSWIPALTEQRRKEFQEQFDRCEKARTNPHWHCTCLFYDQHKD